MQIKFEKVLPIPIKELNYAKSEIWDKNNEFLPDTKYLIKAPSGTGKTTFVSIIYGIRRDYDGTVMIDGNEIRSYKSAKIMEYRRKKMAVVFQGLQIFDELTALENIQLKNDLTKFNTETKIREMAEKLGIASLLERKAAILSFGQKQRIALVRAFCQPFEFLLLDEPFSHLDLANAKICLELINEECSARGAGYILTTLGSDYEGKFDKIMEL